MQGSGIRVSGSGSRVQGLGFRVQGLGLRLWGLRFLSGCTGQELSRFGSFLWAFGFSWFNPRDLIKEYTVNHIRVPIAVYGVKGCWSLWD